MMGSCCTVKSTKLVRGHQSSITWLECPDCGQQFNQRPFMPLDRFRLQQENADLKEQLKATKLEEKEE
jgi:hypothetical protein